MNGSAISPTFASFFVTTPQFSVKSEGSRPPPKDLRQREAKFFYAKSSRDPLHGYRSRPNKASLLRRVGTANPVTYLRCVPSKPPPQQMQMQPLIHQPIDTIVMPNPNLSRDFPDSSFPKYVETPKKPKPAGKRSRGKSLAMNADHELSEDYVLPSAAKQRSDCSVQELLENPTTILDIQQHNQVLQSAAKLHRDGPMQQFMQEPSGVLAHQQQHHVMPNEQQLFASPLSSPQDPSLPMSAAPTVIYAPHADYQTSPSCTMRDERGATTPFHNQSLQLRVAPEQQKHLRPVSPFLQKPQRRQVYQQTTHLQQPQLQNFHQQPQQPQLQRMQQRMQQSAHLQPPQRQHFNQQSPNLQQPSHFQQPQRHQVHQQTTHLQQPQLLRMQQSPHLQQPQRQHFHQQPGVKYQQQPHQWAGRMIPVDRAHPQYARFLQMEHEKRSQQRMEHNWEVQQAPFFQMQHSPSSFSSLPPDTRLYADAVGHHHSHSPNISMVEYEYTVIDDLP